VAGGGGLIALPALLYAGITPLQALATNKFQGTFGTFASTLNFVRHGHINLKQMMPAVFLTFLGAAAGTFAVQLFSTDFLRLFMPIALVAMVLFFTLQPTLGEQDRHHRIGIWVFAAVFGFSLGFYDGFFGPGTGSFFTLTFVLLLGFNLVKATANTKLLNFTSNITSLSIFIYGGHVVWPLGLVMAVGQFTGGFLGAHMTIRHGASLIRPLVIIMSSAMALKLLFDNFTG
ncbi:MAG: TSUP family transporter, partial [bacterium]|nr:TSUP family transporter [bacterium]